MLKKITNNLAYIIIGVVLAVSAGVVYAANVSVPQATQKGDLPSGLATGNYQLLHPGTNGQVLSASSTSVNGLAWVANSASAGATTTIQTGATGATFNGPNFIYASGTATGLNLNITGSGSTITWTPQLQTGYNIPLTASTTEWSNLNNNVLSRLVVSTSTTGSGFNISTSTNTLNINLPNADGTHSGQLTSTDWTTFNGKQAAGNYLTALTGDVAASGPGSAAATLATVNGNVGSFTYGSFTVNGKGLITAASSGAAPVTTFASGTTGTIFNGSISGNTLTLNLPFASGSNTGQLQSGDWTTFNNKVATTRNINTTAPITGGGDLSADRTIACNVASILQAGCLGSADFLTFNNKLSGVGTAGQIAYYSAPTTTTSSALFTFSTATGLTAATSTFNTSTIAQLTLGNGLSSTILAVDPNGKVIATTTSAGGVTAVNGGGSIISSGGATPTIQLQNLTNSDILYGQGNSTIATSSLFTFNGTTLATPSATISSFLTVTGTSTLATTTITRLTVNGNSISGANSGDITVTGENYLTLSGQQITMNAVALGGTNVSGVLTVAKGGTGTSTAPTQQGQLLGADGTGAKYGPITLNNTATYSWATGTAQQLSGNVLKVPNAITFNNGGAGASSGQTFDGSSAQTMSYNTIGAQVAGTYVTSVSGAGSVISSGGTTPTLQLQNLTTNAILFGQGNSTIATSSNLTFVGGNTLTVTGSTTISSLLTVGGTLGVTGTSTLATTTISGINVVGKFDKSFSLASTTPDYLGSSFSTATFTVLSLWNPSYPVTLTKLYCKTNTGTVLLNVGGNLLTCTSGGASSTPSSNFAIEADVPVSLGTGASSPANVTVTTSWRAQ